MPVETIYYDGRVPLRVQLFSHGMFFLVLFGWNVGLFYAWFERLRYRVKITDQRIVITRGWISQREINVEYYRVSNVEYTQTAFQRVFRIGIITVIAEADKEHPIDPFPMRNPKDFKEKIRGAVLVRRREMITTFRDGASA